ncbi:MAG: TlpA family protein disulfide reductase [Gemmatimonadaceae bacterium]
MLTSSLRGVAALSAFAVLTLTTSATRLHGQTAGIAMGATAPAAMVETLDGTPMNLGDIYGKGTPVVLEFWATWCPLCRKLEPAMAAARSKYEGRVKFVGVGVSANQSPARQKAHIEANKMAGMYVFDRDDAATKAFQVPHTSYVVVLDGAGKVVYTGVGESQDIDAAVKKVLGVM